MIERIRRLLHQQCGLDLSTSVVDSGLRRTMRQAGREDREAFITQVLLRGPEFEALVEQVVVPETWFFRDADAFTATGQIARDMCRQLARPVSILSLPCASGEEPYSIAMALLDAGLAESDFRIDGIDLSAHAIAKAQRGFYQANAFRTRELDFRDRYFSAREDGFEIAPEVRRLVNFQRGNLFDPAAAFLRESYDIIFCRNLLIYFDATTQLAAIRRLEAQLQPHGVLFVGYAEAATVCQHGFTVAPHPRAFALRRPTPEEMQRHRKTIPARARPSQRPRVRPMAATAAPATASVAATAPVLRPSSRAVPQPLLDDSLLMQGRTLADEGKISDATAKFRAYLESVPDSAEAYFMLGLLSEQLGDAAAAEAHLRRAVYFDPDHYEALCHLALIMQQQGDRAGASLYKRRAARVHERQGREDAAK